jgi:hypothetical protein
MCKSEHILNLGHDIHCTGTIYFIFSFHETYTHVYTHDTTMNHNQRHVLHGTHVQLNSSNSFHIAAMETNLKFTNSDNKTVFDDTFQSQVYDICN